MTTATATAADNMAKARTLLVLDHPFFAALALRMPMVADESVRCSATDSTRILYNPIWAAEIPPRLLAGVLGELVMHCASGHCWRMPPGGDEGRAV